MVPVPEVRAEDAGDARVREDVRVAQRLAVAIQVDPFESKF